MKIEMTIEEYYFENGHEFLTGRGLQELDNCRDILFAYPDSSWLEEEMGETDCGPFFGYWYGKIMDEEKSLFAILKQSDFSRLVEFFDSKEALIKAWEGILYRALLTARETGDWEYFGEADEEGLQDMINQLAKEGHHGSE
jgi:hypothetical protein